MVHGVSENATEKSEVCEQASHALEEQIAGGEDK